MKTIFPKWNSWQRQADTPYAAFDPACENDIKERTTLTIPAQWIRPYSSYEDVEHGADVYAKVEGGNDAVSLSKERGNLRIAKLLESS
ncbi:hypothetical protein [Paenibacillus ginsengarvi]|uniref:hypothetical protein n=1 Tax=Paenibacillus ginsengarvi TaxID=400777 RepID=UPI0011C47EAC|nr:hypothetical protein [Paenibacillus ginsengarvi]